MTLDGCDPWVEQHIRLAERRGLLTGKYLSGVQALALEIVMVLEARDRRRDSEEDFKRAIVSADPDRFLPNLYPESFKVHVSGEELTDADLGEEASGTWEMPEFDPGEAEDILASLMAAEAEGSLSLDDIEQYE